MLSEEEIREIEEELPHYESRRRACIDAMKIVQRHRGWISDEALQDIAEFLGASVDELDGVATFYNLIYRRRVGKHVILLCDSVTCWMLGTNDLLAHFKKRLGIGFGETTEDGLFTLLPIACLGACDKAPAMKVDDDLYVELTLEKVDELLGRIAMKG